MVDRALVSEDLEGVISRTTCVLMMEFKLLSGCTDLPTSSMHCERVAYCATVHGVLCLGNPYEYF